ncbi:MAG: DUF3095 family protein [Phycisphaera sp.]|nr:DUF3095 family protein [Phycisphaera sp.]
MTTDHFYADLPVHDDFASTADRSRYAPLPDDWYVLISDVVGSTAAIERGLYKQVNLVGASTIAAVTNAAKPTLVPFVFGGDGATLAVPPGVLDRAKAALRATCRMASKQFGLDLRAAVVPVRDIHAAGPRVLVARCRVSDHYDQAAFTGGGLAWVESLVKRPDRGSPYQLDVPDRRDAPGDFSGIECRWEDIPSPHGETITLIVQAVAGDDDAHAAVYGRVLDEIHAIYGDEDACRPVRLDVMDITRSRAKLQGEVGVRTYGISALGRWLYRRWLDVQMMVGRYVFPRNATFNGVDWGQYQRDVVTNTDFRKFDDMLRLVIAGTPAQRDKLTAFLDERRAAGELTYGLHVAPSALMTCLIFTRVGGHVHFVDGSAGGYAMAAKQLKSQRAPSA